MFEQIEKFQQALKLMRELDDDFKGQVIYELLVNNELNYTNLSTQYVRALEIQKKDNQNMLHEAECCILEHVLDKKYHPSGRKKKKIELGKDESKHVQRSLYLLNQSNSFLMEETNKLFGYNEEEAKKLSWYEQNKQY